VKSCGNAERIRKGLAGIVVSRQLCHTTMPRAGSMHDMAKEGYIFWLLMPDRNLPESALAANLIQKGLTADEVIEVLQKRREANAS
jgi:hypothetical protein